MGDVRDRATPGASRARKRYCAACRTRLRRGSARCPYCRRYALSRTRLLVIVAASLACVAVLLGMARLI